MNDITLREKALAEDPDLEKLSRWGQARTRRYSQPQQELKYQKNQP
jgi:hypothetical protein